MTNNRIKEVLNLLTYFVTFVSILLVYVYDLNVMCYLISTFLFIMCTYSISYLPDEETY